jgi:hypothetical protein
VGLVDDDRVVLRELRVALRFCQQDAVGHELDRGARAQLLVEAHLVAHQAAAARSELLCDARGDRARRDAPRLRVADEAPGAAPHVEQDLRQLRGLAGAGLAAHHHHRMALDRRTDLLAACADRQGRVEADR